MSDEKENLGHLNDAQLEERRKKKEEEEKRKLPPTKVNTPPAKT